MHEGLGAIGKTGVELVEDTELAAHVVGRLGFVAERWAAQDEFLARVGHQVGQVRGAPRKLADGRATLQPGDMTLEVRIDDGRVEFFAGAYLGGLVGERHAISL